jgi:plasmid stabilization system protein ParE
MAFNQILLPRARKEILDAIEWYESRQEGLGEKFLAEVENMSGRIVEDPFLFPKSDETEYRRLVLKKFPFVIIFTLTKKEVIIHSVFHTRLDPNKKPSE